MSCFARTALDRRDRLRVLAGVPASGQEDAGRIICSCFSVGSNTLRHIIDALDDKTPEAIGRKCQAGTKCGSCVPELRDLIAENQL